MAALLCGCSEAIEFERSSEGGTGIETFGLPAATITSQVTSGAKILSSRNLTVVAKLSPISFKNSSRGTTTKLQDPSFEAAAQSVMQGTKVLER